MTAQYRYRPTYNAHGQHDGINPVRVYPVVHECKQANKYFQITLALAILALTCAGAWALVTFGASLPAVF